MAYQKGIKATVFSSDVHEEDSKDKITFVMVFTKKVTLFDLAGFIFAFFLFFKLIYYHRKLRIDVL